MIVDCPMCGQPYDDGYTAEAKSLLRQREDRAARTMMIGLAVWATYTSR